MPPKAKSKKDTAVVKHESNLPATTDAPLGFEDMDQEDFSLPYIKIMQPGSPEVDNDDIKADKGDLLNSLSNYNYGTGLIFIPILFSRRRIKWLPREDGGGIECGSIDGKAPDTGAKFSAECSSCVHSQWDNKTSTPPACDMFRVFPSIILGLKEEFDGSKLVAISFARTNAVQGKKLLNTARMSGGAIFSHAYKLKTTKQKNDKGTYWTFEVAPAPKLNPRQIAEAEGHFNVLSSMRVNVGIEREVEVELDKDGKPLPF